MVRLRERLFLTTAAKVQNRNAMAVKPMAVISQTIISSNCILSIPLKAYRRRISPENHTNVPM
jgi:hypothetical protein